MAALLGTSAATLLIGFTSGNEGVALTPYQDKLAHDVWTVCYGDTGVPMRRYNLGECKELLATRLADYAGPVRQLTPGFDNLSDGQKVAIVDLVYNIGVQAYERVPVRDKRGRVIAYRASTIRQLYSRGDFPLACEAFTAYRFSGGRDCADPANRCSGLMKRREAERAACLGM
ncbi:lysozyme [Ralstonia phage PQ43W]